MRSLLTLLLLLLCYAQSFGQERTISGRLTDETGLPLPQVTILIKGTSIGTATDADGNYSINVPIGATLIFRFLGYGTKEVVVTKDNLQPVGTKRRKKARANQKPMAPVPFYMYRDSVIREQAGVAILSDTSLSHNLNHLSIFSLKSLEVSQDGFTIKHFPNSYSKPVRFSFSSYLRLERVNQLPALQTSYAQGRGLRGSLIWRGPEQGEIFSWGPAISSLEFDGGNYAFDNNGALVAIGRGNGMAANAYDPTSFFRTGYTVGNELMISAAGPNSSDLIFDIEHLNRQGVIPNADYQKTNLKAKWDDLEIFDDLRINTSVVYNRSKGNLLARGGNLNALVASIYRTPPTFDNANGLSSRSAAGSGSSFRLPNGGLRAHAPGTADNPYGLANELPDHEESNRFISSVALNYDRHMYTGFSFELQAATDLQTNKSLFGIPPGYASATAGRLTERNDRQSQTNGSFRISFKPYLNGSQLEFQLKYQLSHHNRSLERTDGTGFSDASFGNISAAIDQDFTKRDLARTVQELLFKTEFQKWNVIEAGLSNRTYFSNTVSYDQFNNFFPAANLSLNLAQLLKIRGLNELSIFGSGSRSLREAPLLFNSWAYGSTPLSIDRYNQFYESGELFAHNQLAPEIISSFETGLRFQPFYRLKFSSRYFNNTTQNYISPESTGNSFALNNIGEISTRGFTASIDYNFYSGDVEWFMNLGWNKFNTEVTEVYGSSDRIALAGFASVQSSFTKDQPLGAIYGSSYLRNDQGEKIIGSDGFPIKDPNPKVIGNPLPDWSLNWSAGLEWEDFTFHFAFDVKKGGDIWNGTGAALNYLGRSSGTADLRNTTGFIFEGVTQSGLPNTTPVSFYDPSRPLTENRWVRYGWESIAEAYIEDASWIRLSQVHLSHTFFFRDKKIRELDLSLAGYNLILITPYTGVDPAATLFGYANGSGLDLFNLPSTRSYSFKVTLQF